MNVHDGPVSSSSVSEKPRRGVEVIQDLQWEEFIEAAKLTTAHADIETFRKAAIESVFVQTSYRSRHRNAANFLKAFLPDGSLSGPVVAAWSAFGDEAVLRPVMRWQYVTSNPAVADFVDGQFASIKPGQPADEALNAYLVGRLGSLREKTRNRIRANLRKIGLLLAQGKQHYRVIPEISPGAIAVLLAWLFAREPQVVSWQTLVSDPWWKRLGIPDEAMLREKLHETSEEGLIARFSQVDTLDQVTTRFSQAELEAGRIER